MTEQKLPEIWVIRNKYTGEIFRASSGKTSWKAKGHAKNAWANTTGCYHESNVIRICAKYSIVSVKNERGRIRVPRFDEQDTWVLDELYFDVTTRLTQAENILRNITSICNDIKNGIEASKQIDDVIEGYFGGRGLID